MKDTEEYYRSLYLLNDPYNERLLRQGITRERLKNLELGHEMVYGDRTENERVNKVVDFNAQRDTSVCRDTSMLHFPKWKQDKKDKWVSAVDSI